MNKFSIEKLEHLLFATHECGLVSSNSGSAFTDNDNGKTK